MWLTGAMGGISEMRDRTSVAPVSSARMAAEAQPELLLTQIVSIHEKPAKRFRFAGLAYDLTIFSIVVLLYA